MKRHCHAVYMYLSLVIVFIVSVHCIYFSGCTDMKRMWFVSVGELPVRTIHDEWVDLKYLEKGRYCYTVAVF